MTDQPAASEKPEDPLAELAGRAERGEITHIDLIDAFLVTTVYVPSTTDPEGGSIDPVISRIDEIDYLIAASTPEALEQTGDVARFAVPMTGRTLVDGMNPDIALMINLGAGAFAMPKPMLDDLRARTPLG